MLTLITFSFVAFFSAIFLRFLNANKPPVFEVYQNQNRWYYLKYALVYLLISFRKYRKPRSEKDKEDGSSGYGVKSKSRIEDMERTQVLPPPDKYPDAVDAVYFNSGDRHGNYVVIASARRQHNIVQCLGIIRLEKLGMLELMEMPETNFITKYDNAFRIEGLHIQPVEPMKKWFISFDRPMKLTQNDGNFEKNVRVRMELLWTAIHPCFDFDVDQDIHVLCDAIAREPWTRDMFKRLEATHQTHYEQFGEMCGTVIVEGHGEYDVEVQGIRDHSYGNSRNWGLFHRYGLQFAFMEDGTALAIGRIAMPGLMTNLLLGFVNFPDGRLEPIRYSDFELRENGEESQSPKRLRINCMTANGNHFSMAGEVIAEPFFFMGTNWASKVYERMCQYDVNGQRAWGISEWQYRNYSVKRKESPEEQTLNFDMRKFGH